MLGCRALPRKRWWLAAAALAAGLIARVAFLADKPLWRDEAWLAWILQDPLEIVERRPVPVGFVTLSRLFDRLSFLTPEVRLRLLPLACGLAALPALGALALRLGATPAVAVSALWLAAGGPGLIHYSRELKPYSIDLLLACLTPLLALKLADGEPSRRWTAWLPLLGVVTVAPWVSFGGVFAVLATLIVMAAHSLRAGAPRDRIAWLVVAAAFLSSLAAAYFLVVRQQASNPRLLGEWEDELVSGAAGLPPMARVFGRYFTVAAEYTFPGLGPLALVLMAVGALTWPRRHRWLLLSLALGTAAAATASALAGAYLITGRLLLCAAPTSILLASSGIVYGGDRAAGWLRPGRVSWLGAVAAVALGLWWSAHSVVQRVRPPGNDVQRYFLDDVLHDVGTLVDRLELLAAPGDPVMTSRYSGDQFRYYARGRLPGAMVCRRINCPEEGPAMLRWLAGVQGRGWMILLTEEDRPWRRRFVEKAGFDVQVAATARGAVLWRVTRRRL